MNYSNIICPTNRLQVTILHEKDVLTGVSVMPSANCTHTNVHGSTCAAIEKRRNVL
ncbi:hypothetical protein [Escherichia coli]|uniref:hypothetical protein n=1 Tax=Escherichia coli TaxID=562 RepID=UPI001B1B7432|nr:hypothetical protein [Escherichia coli]MEA0422709.1 hypothetical protein [Escherichia coli]HBB1758005.1 hypothetical protein [Escherichia coli]